MDFYSMPRRQLQALCKQNRIPANITNVAMADALQALHATGSLENAQEVLHDLTPLVPSSRKASLRRQAPSSVVNFEASMEPSEQPASPLPRARRVTVKASEIRRLTVEGEENEKEKVEKEAIGEATPMTVTKCSSMKPPPRSTRRVSTKNDVEAKEEEPLDAMKTPAPLTGRRSAARKLAKTPFGVEQEAADTVVSARVTTRRNTRQSTRATIEDSAATSTVRRSSRIRTKTEESALKMGSSFQEVAPEQGIEISNALVEEDDNGDKDCHLAVVDSDVPQNSLEEAVIAPEAKQFATVAGVSEEEHLDKVEVDDHCEKGCTLVVVGANIPMHDLEEDRIIPNGELIDMPTEEAPDADVKELGTVAQQHLVLLPKNDEEKPMDMITEKDDEVAEIAPEDEEFTDVKELGSMVRITPNGEELGVAKEELIDMPTEEAPKDDVKELRTVAQQHLVSLQLHLLPKNDEVKLMDMIAEKDDEVYEIAPEDEEFTDVKELGSMVQHQEDGDTQDDSDINEDGGIHGDQHQVVESGENDDNEDEVVQESEVSIEKVLPETKCDFEGSPVQGLITSLENLEITKDLHLEDLAPRDDETEYAADGHTEEIDEDFHLEDLAPVDDETKHEIPAATVDSFIQNQASDIPGEVIAVTKCQPSGTDKENDKQNEDKKQNVQENLELMSLRTLKKMYKEKMSNVDKVETKRQALNDVNQNIVL